MTIDRPLHHVRRNVPRFINWAGSKQQVAKNLLQTPIPRVRCYREPFLGSGAVFFWLASAGYFTTARLSDANPHLIAAFQALQSSPNDIVRATKLHALLDSDVHYASVLRRINHCGTSPDPTPQQAADIVYVLAQSFQSSWYETGNGQVKLFRRRNAKSFRPRIDDFGEAAALLGLASIERIDFREALREVDADDLVFLDPPYLPALVAHDPRGYTATRFCAADLDDLVSWIERSVTRGVHVIFCWHTKLISEPFCMGRWSQVGRDYVWTSYCEEFD